VGRTSFGIRCKRCWAGAAAGIIKCVCYLAPFKLQQSFNLTAQGYKHRFSARNMQGEAHRDKFGTQRSGEENFRGLLFEGYRCPHL